ncbi:MAG TPA: bifunctional demethylmenaquinone methyltransferase/2-methoxy-6-polyprenyl-1,4-benzoquinol methylase UbiE [Thermoanaerobaculia bacterium]|nr:bifunctional demethylmenaquinone methyltransferase/2-methoxy-6-polyprenyl-1,4-benzoquinol methylase UbiE [Thermoanaerobaculia bacterium]
MSRQAGPDPAEIRAMFGSIAKRYDRANTILSGGVHHLWRRTLVRWSGAQPGDRVLDCATGTGDLAIAFARAVGPEGRVIGTDFSSEMLAPAPAKAAKKGVEVAFETADVTALPYPDASFDVASIAFGIRNVADPATAMHEMARVVRPGGRVVVLEFGRPDNPFVRPLFGFYSRRILPALGGLLTGHRDAYGYLDRSAAEFPTGPRFTSIMLETGLLEQVESRSLHGGIAWAYRGVRTGRAAGSSASL